MQHGHQYNGDGSVHVIGVLCEAPHSRMSSSVASLPAELLVLILTSFDNEHFHICQLVC